MCGFAGFYATPGRDVVAGDDALVPMIDTIAHRGPDQAGTWASPEDGIALGFRRLAILDLSEEGHQPMHSASDRFVMLFNGEVYNYQELRSEFESAGHRFRGHSDTEVILATFEQRGIEEALETFNGMFALAVWDKHEKRLVLARDRMGIKPLYVYREPGFVSFGSELKALVRGPRFDRSISSGALESYLRYLYVPAPQTIYERATKLLPGCSVSISIPDDEVPAPRPFWSLSEAVERGAADPIRSAEESVEALEELLSDSVKRRMIADVPLGALLSGGIDSSAVVSLMQENSDQKVKTFTIGFGGTEHDESAHARAIAEHLGTEHRELQLTGDDALNVVPSLAYMFDEPHADPSQIPTYLVSEMAKREVTVALSGDGGDELFAGYNRYLYGVRTLSRLGKIPALPRQLMKGGLRSLSPEGWARAYRGVAGLLPGVEAQRLPEVKIRKIIDLLGADSEAARYRSLMSAWQDPASLLRESAPDPDRAGAVLESDRPETLIDRMMLADQTTYLPGDLLAKVDRASMAVSLEARVPILDHRIVELAWRMPEEAKIQEGRTKWALRQVLYKRVPRELIERPKTGFSVPIDDWLKGPLRDWADDLLSEDRLNASGLLRPEPIMRVWRDVREGRGSGIAMWAVLMFQAWHAEWIEAA